MSFLSRFRNCDDKAGQEQSTHCSGHKSYRYANTLDTPSASSPSRRCSRRRALSSSASLRLLYLFPFSRFSAWRVAAGVTNSVKCKVSHRVSTVPQRVIPSRDNGAEAHAPGFEKTVAPPNAPSKMRIGVSTKRGPISTSDVCAGPLGCSGSFSKICGCIS